MVFFSRSVFNTFSIVVLLVVLLATFNAQAADDEYLKQLASEVKNVHLDKSGQRNNNNTAHNASGDAKQRKWVGECDYSNEVMPAGLAWAEFSSYLKQCSLATFVYYRRLDSDLQRSVYNTYSKASTMKSSKLKKDILTYF